ncbi:MAG: calcium-binding protein, partial [Selenomonadaceae bacterium]|nr:calcium-binding protein [Selenomonadaceae bacterium]
SLNQSNVTISSGYTLALANDVTKPKTTAAGWSLSGTTATYKNAKTTAGYKLNSDNQITYIKTSGGKTLITVEGVKSLDGIKLSSKTVKVSASALDKSKVTLTGEGYKLALDNAVSKPATTKTWSFNSKNKAATYTQKTTAGYTLASNSKSISYSDASTKDLVTLTGVKSASGLSVSKKVVTVGAAALGTDKITISDGYTLALGSDVSKPKTKDAAWSLSDSTATYKSSYKKAGYTLAGDSKSISYTEATSSKALATVKGAKKNSFTVSGNKITLKNSTLKNKVTVSGGYNFNYASNYKKATISGSSKVDTITTNGSDLSVSGGKGNDTLKIFGSKTTVKGGDGADVFIFKAGNNVISDYAAADKISVAGTAKVTTSGSNLVFTVGTGKLTVTGGKDKKVSYIDDSGENVYNYKAGVKTSGTTITLLEKYKQASVDVAGYQNVNASAVQLDISITGNALMNSLKGGKGNDTLQGGGSNDTLTGGDGADVFIYSSGDGNDVITDYNEDDTIKISKGTASVSKKNKDVIFTVGSGKITVKGAADKVVTYIDGDGNTNYYPKPTKDSYIINGTAVTV